MKQKKKSTDRKNDRNYYRDRNRERSRSGQSSASNRDNLLKKHERLQDDYLKCRKKHFETFHRADENKKKKLENELFSAIKSLRNFENHLYRYHRSLLYHKIHSYKLDRSYTKSVDPVKNEDTIAPRPLTEIHLTKEQLNRPSYRLDTEESKGHTKDHQRSKK